MALEVKLEYVAVDDGDDSVMWQIRRDPPAYIDRIGKEEYSRLDTTDQDPFITGLFDVVGVTEVSSQAYRIWVMKSPAYEWQEVNDSLQAYLLDEFGETDVEYLQGSANKDGTGFRLVSDRNRRDL